jgi:DNA-binding transcriptional regulator YdaS (Cro superfamily)
MIYHSAGSQVQSRKPTSERDVVRPDDVRRLAEAMGCRTQREFAQRLGVSQPRVSQILSGAHPLKPGALLTLVRALQERHGLQAEILTENR